MTIIEKIARALAHKHGYSWEECVPAIADAKGNLNQEDYQDFARTALVVLKDNMTGAMIDGPGIDTLDAAGTEWQFIRQDRCQQIFNVIIDNALSEKP